MNISIDKIRLHFVCEECGYELKDVDLWDVLITGSPVCLDCEEEMVSKEEALIKE